VAARKRVSLAEAYEQSRAVSGRRRPQQERQTRAELDKRAPRAPDAIERAYLAQMEVYQRKVERAVAQALKSTPPDFDGLQKKLDGMAFDHIRRLGIMGRRINAHARRQVSGLLGVDLPALGPVDDLVVDAFMRRNLELLLRAGRDLVSRARTKMAQFSKPETQQRHITRLGKRFGWRWRLIAQDQVARFESEVIQNWALEAGQDGYYWVTCRDDRVRPGHAALEGRFVLWSQPPSTGAREGHNHAGRSIRCRCRPALVPSC